jgi:hypothetical protein
MKMRHPASARLQRVQFPALLELIKQPAHAFKILRRRRVDEVCVAANNQHGSPGMILAPRSQTRRDQLGRCRVDRFLAFANLGPEAGFSLGKRQPRQARVDEIADLAERSGGCAFVKRDDSFDATIDPTSTASAWRKLSGTSSAAASLAFCASTTPALAEPG